MEGVVFMEYFAKINPKQTIQEHTEKALELYQQFRRQYPYLISDEEWELLELAIKYHDLGKANVLMQDFFYRVLNLPLPLKVNYNLPKIYHNHLSCAFIDFENVINKYGIENYDILCKSVYHHHNRPETDKKILEYYIKNHLPKDIIYFSFPLLHHNLQTALNAEFTPYVDMQNSKIFKNPSMFRKYVMIKGLLHKIDYNASAMMDVIEEDVKDIDGLSAAEKIKRLYPSLRDMQIYMIQNKNKNVILVASTGTGKTEAAVLWIEDEKGFYTLPLQIAINSTYSRIKNKIKYSKVRLLHSNALSTYIKEEKDNGDIDAQEEYQKAKLFSAPLTVCTVDQLFKFVFKYNGFEHLLATLAYSKVVIDEIQMYSPDIVASLIYGLKLITDFGGKFAIVTATFPPILGDLMRKYRIPFEGPVFFHNPDLPTRHRIKFFKDKDFDYKLIVDLGSKYKVVVFTNTVKKAQEVYNELKEKTNTWIIHSKYIRKHRRMLEEKILEFAPNKKDRDTTPGIWVSTQVLEASLDLDFDFGFSSLSSIESLLQREGRDRRNRLYNEEEPNFYIYDNKDGIGTIIDPQIYYFSLHAVEKYDGKLLYETDAQDDKQAMIEMVYDKNKNPKILSSDYFKNIIKMIDGLSNLTPYDLSHKEVIKQFRNIDSITIMPKPIYTKLLKSGKIKEWEDNLKQNIPLNEKQLIIDEINEYTLNLSHWRTKEHLIKQRDIIYPNSGIMVWDCEYDFDEKTLKGIGLKDY